MGLVFEMIPLVDTRCARVLETCEPLRDFFTTDSNGWVVPDIDFVKSLNDRFDFVLVNCSLEHWGSERDFPLVARISQQMQQHYHKDFVCLSHDPVDSRPQDHIFYFPWFAWQGQAAPRCSDAIVEQCHRQFIFSSLGRLPKDFRIANFLLLQQKPYRPRCLVSLFDIPQPNLNNDGEMRLTAQEQQAWDQIRHSLPSKFDDPLYPDGFNLLWAFQHPAYSDSYLHVVSESTMRSKIFITEKTWQPIAAGQLFVILGNPGTVSHLRELGVDVFDDLIDHSYDNDPDPRSRLHKTHLELDRLSELDFASIYVSTLERRRMNRDKFANGSFSEPFLAQIRTVLPSGIRLHGDHHV